MTNSIRPLPRLPDQPPSRDRLDGSDRVASGAVLSAAGQTRVEAILAEPGTASRLASDGNSTPVQGSFDEFCTLEVRFNPLGPGYHHAYLVAQDLNSTRVFRGGPGRSPSERPDIGKSGTLISGSGGASSQRAGTQQFASSNSGNSVSAGSGPGGDAESSGIFGAIEVDSAEYDHTSADWNASGVVSVGVVAAAGSCATIGSTLTRLAEDISRRHIPYNPLTANSNSVARELLSRAGYPDVEPPVWAPGWDTKL